ncbi:MAG: LLM class flavin-dependent oxidoreductase [Geodermatophilaceae bacterium]
MKIGLQIPNFTWPGGAPTLGQDLARIARTADDAGFDAVAVMDHLFQIGAVGPIENDMLEGYTTLGFLAANTSRARLFTLVTGVTYRDPGMLAKIITTLDVLSGGRAWLGVGAAWNDEESRGLGLLFPPTAERFERLEETLQICLQMWSDSEASHDGRHYQLRADAQLPAEPDPAAPADHDRRRWGEEDAAAGGAVRPGVQPLLRTGAGAQARRTQGPLRA